MTPGGEAVQVSAGGVVFRYDAGQVWVALIGVGPDNRWQLPKGLIGPGETTECAAQREVREETGLHAELIEPIQRIDYWYYAGPSGQRVRYHKYVHYYLMRYLSGQVSDHDHEVNEARWFEIGEAQRRLAFHNEKNVVYQAQQRIQDRVAPSSDNSYEEGSV
ncbi:MAG: NUDIX hydrolase [Chloroflexi bacterium]|nr:NUDIX hydrolase [Anaerolineaceae bacterium]NMB88962.1 NUDIX hydrolase [Chloroflexota bacterium]